MRSTVLLFLAAALSSPAQQLNPNILWGVNSANNIFRVNTYDLSAPPWRQVTPPAGITPAQVAVAHDGSIFLVGNDTRSQNVFTLGNNGVWRPAVFGVLASVAPANAKDVWGVTPTGQIQRWQAPSAGFDTIAAGFTATQVSVALDGTVWALDTAGRIYSYDGAAWLALPGILRNVTVISSNSAWGVAPDNTIWRWDGANWNFINKPANATPAQTSANADGTVYLTDSAGLLYLRTGDDWRLFPGVLTQISASATDRVFYDEPVVVQSPNSAWTRQTNTNAGAGGYLQSSKAGDALTFKFNGDSVSLHRLMSPTGGRARVTIDDRSYGSIDFYAAQPAWFVPAVLEGLGAGEHTLVLTVLETKNSASTGTQVNLDSICAPAPQRPMPYQNTALALLNQRRAQMSLPAAKQSTLLNLTAQAHANFMAVNNSLNHNESPTGIGFTGVGPSDRARYFGLDSGFGAAENINNNPDPDNCISFWADTIYHRTPIQNYYYTDIGFGSAATPRGMCAMNFTSRGSPAPPADRLFSTMPGNNQMDVPLGYTVDAPDPRLADPSTLGYVISLLVVQGTNSTPGGDTTPFAPTLTDANGRSIPVFAVTKANDPYPESHPADYFVMIPKEPLAPNMVYTARMVGTDSRGNRFDTSWQFTSAPNSTISIERGTRFSYFDSSTTAAAIINFTTAGPVDVAQTSVAFGPTTALGRTAQPTVVASTPNGFTVRMEGLPRGGLAYYRISATDAQGRTSTSKLIQIRVP